MTPRAFVFDIDRTLTASKEAIEPSMAELLTKLINRAPVGIITGGPMSVITANVLSHLASETRLSNLYVLPTSGAALYTYTGGAWVARYAHELNPHDVAAIDAAITAACEETGLVNLSEKSYGDIVEHRGPQVTLSALGQNAPVDLKEKWDVNGTKKRMLRDAIAKRLPSFDVKTGGATSVDVTQHGINKAYGVRQLATLLGTDPVDMLYVGDALYPGGNDEVVKETGIETRQVSGPNETKQVIADLLVGVSN